MCAGPVAGDTMALLERTQHSHRRLALRALLDQLQANPVAVGRHVDPEEAWQTLSVAEQRNPDAVAEILMYPTVGVWLTRALHYTRPGRTTAWRELGYLQVIAAAAAVRSGCSRTIRVPVSHGIVALPTVGHVRIPGTFPVGSVDVVSTGADARIQVGRAVTIPLDDSTAAFTPADRQATTSRGLTLRTWLEDKDPYHGFGAPRRPTELTEAEFAEWRKLLHEAWDVLTLHHPEHAHELAAGLRTLGPIEPDLDTVGASSPAAFGGIRLSANGSATEFAEALVHEMQHSKLNALLSLVKLTDDDHARRYLAPWRDDPRPLVGVIHGIYAFACGVEFWARQDATTGELDEARRIAFHIAFRRTQVRRALRMVKASGHLTRPGHALVDVVSARLSVCEQLPVSTELSRTVTMMIDDHQALWRLRHTRPDTAAVNAMAAAWIAGAAAPSWSGDHQVIVADEHRLPANRRTLLRAKATDPDLFASLVRRPMSLPGTTPRADAALSTGDYPGAVTAYAERVRTEPDDMQAWAGLGLALRAQGQHTDLWLEHPELIIAVYRRVRTLCERTPDPTALSAWLASAL